MSQRFLAGMFVTLCLLACWGSVSAQRLELVESFPIETDFDQPDLRDTQEVWLEMVHEAKSEILWQTFYLAHEKGRASEPVVQALKEAAGRGVQVKILVDGKFVKTYPETLAELGALDGIEVRESPVGPWLGGVMHAKAIFVDDRWGFVGSQNFDWRSLQHIRELGVAFDSPQLTQQYATAFRWEWDHAGAPVLPTPPFAAVSSDIVEIAGSHVLPTFSPNAINGPDTAGDEAEIIALIDKAQHSAEVALLSYSPTNHEGDRFYPDLDNALRRAALRGVQIRMILGHWVEGKKGEDFLRSLDVLDNVEIRACRIPLASEGEIPFARVHHSKYLVVDGQEAWLGTSNWSQDYFQSSRNYGLVILDGPLPPRLHQLFEFDWQRSSALKS